MVEFAIALPLLLLMILSIAEFGRMLFQYNSLLQASRDAGRYVAGKAWNRTLGKIVLLEPSQGIDLISEAKNIAVYGVPSNPSVGRPVVTGLGTANVSVSAVGTDHVQVSISFSFKPLIGSGIPALIGKGNKLGFPMVATTVMRAL